MNGKAWRLIRARRGEGAAGLIRTSRETFWGRAAASISVTRPPMECPKRITGACGETTSMKRSR